MKMRLQARVFSQVDTETGLILPAVVQGQSSFLGAFRTPAARLRADVDRRARNIQEAFIDGRLDVSRWILKFRATT
jgi:hypothetical protein